MTPLIISLKRSSGPILGPAWESRGAPCARERFDLRRPALRDPGACPLASFAAVGRNGHQLHPAGRETRVLDHETNRCDGGLNELRMDAGSTLCALLRRSPRLDSAMEACSGAHSYGRKAHRSNLHRLSHPRSRCSHNAAPSGWAGRLPAAELPWSSLSMRLALLCPLRLKSALAPRGEPRRYTVATSSAPLIYARSSRSDIYS